MRKLFAFVALLASVAVLLAWDVLRPLPLAAQVLDVSVEPGSSMRSVALQLSRQGVGITPWRFVLLARASGDAHRVQAGSYRIEQGVSAWALLRMLAQGDTHYATLPVIEGWSFRRLRQALAAQAALRQESSAMTEPELLRAIGLDAAAAEGLFFPDTYHFARGSSDLELLRRAFLRMREILEQEWSQRLPGLPLRTPYEALILASIVEKETGLASDRPLVASVFLNRLRAGMPLQTDPTVIYGLGERFDGNLRRRDLQADGPYNTYLRRGLPPTPIALPGREALRAVLQPTASDYLYFVARGDGSSVFSRTLEQHNRAVARYQRGG